MYAVFPSLSRQQWTVRYTPRFSTRNHQKVSGRETRVGLFQHPAWDIELTFDGLRSDAREELQSVISFVQRQIGCLHPFLLHLPDNLGMIRSVVLGVGDGHTTSFSVLRKIGGASEPVQGFIGSPVLRIDTTIVSPSTYTLEMRPVVVTFTNPPMVGSVVTADLSIAHLVRFCDDQEDLERIAATLWELRTLKLETVR